MSWEMVIGTVCGIATGFFLIKWLSHYREKYERKLREMETELLDGKAVILTFPNMTEEKWNHIKSAISELKQAGVEFDYRTDQKFKIHQWGFSGHSDGVYITKGGEIYDKVIVRLAEDSKIDLIEVVNSGKTIIVRFEYSDFYERLSKSIDWESWLKTGKGEWIK